MHVRTPSWTDVRNPTRVVPGHEGDSGFQQLSDNALARPWSFGEPVAAMVSAYQSYTGDEKRRKAEHAAAEAQRAAGITAQNQQLYNSILDDPELVKEWQRRVAGGLPGLTPDEITTLRAQHAQTKLQGSLAGQVNTFFDDPNRVVQQQQATNAMRTNALGDLAQQYTGAATAESQDAGRKGTQGGSYDIENRGTLDRAVQATAAGVEGQAQDQNRALRLRDQQLRTQMLANIYSQNPGTTQGANAHLQALLAQTGGAADLGSEASTSLDISHFGNVLQSQAYGQTAKNLANTANAYAYNSSGGGW